MPPASSVHGNLVVILIERSHRRRRSPDNVILITVPQVHTVVSLLAVYTFFARRKTKPGIMKSLKVAGNEPMTERSTELKDTRRSVRVPHSVSSPKHTLQCHWHCLFLLPSSSWTVSEFCFLPACLSGRTPSLTQGSHSQLLV